MPFARRTGLLAEIDAYARAKDSRVIQVSASIHGEFQAVQIIRADGTRVADLRPLVRLNVSIVVQHDGRRESGSYGTGGRYSYARFAEESVWKGAVDEALRTALVNLESRPAPAGEMPIVLGAGWPGILLSGDPLTMDILEARRQNEAYFRAIAEPRIPVASVNIVTAMV
eukprot:gene48074-65209_t